MREWLENGELVCATDASVEGDRKVVAVWFGSEDTGEHMMIAESVQEYRTIQAVQN